MRTALVTLASLCLAACAGARGAPSSRALEAISRAEDARAADSAELARGLSASSPMLRAAALRALARIEDPRAVPLIIPLLEDSDPSVAKWAAFALGQLGGDAAEKALIEAASGRSSAPDEAVLALGRGASAAAIPAVGGLLDHVKPEVRARSAIALGVLVKRHGKASAPRGVIPKLVRMVADPDRDVRFGATYALMRFSHPEAAIALLPALADPDPEIRAQAARGAGLAGVSPALLDPVLDDRDARVRIETVRALGLVGSSTRSTASLAANRLARMATRELGRWASPAEQPTTIDVLVELLGAALGLGDDGDRTLEIIAEEVPAKARPHELARLSCALAYALDARQQVVDRVKSCGGAEVAPWRRLELAAKLHASLGQLEALEALAADADPRARVAAVDALSSIDTSAARAALVSLVGSSDPYVVAGAAAALGDPIARGARPDGLVPALSAALEKLAGEADPSLLVGVLDAIAGLGKEGIGFVPALERLSGDPRPAVRRRASSARQALDGAPAPLPPGPEAAPRARASGRLRARFETSAGSFEALLFGDVAPRTVARFAELARAGFYKDRTFHRVVPDFVAQGGCPRGDGWGGPGEALLDELSPLPFARGALGIATAGRDTGGSQFFVMHAHHPHLDGEYTLFGQVVSGMEVVDRLTMDDRLIDVSIADDGSADGSIVR